MKPPRFFLIGPPAAGKTTTGRRWAGYFKVPFFDTDAEIERQTGRSIEAWFQKGEEAFRKVEREVIQILISTNASGIWAVGGGFPAQSGAMEMLLQAGYVIWIDPPLKWLLHRWKAAETERPLLRGRSDAEKIALVESRRRFYRMADLHWQVAVIPEELVRYWVGMQLHACA